MKLFTLSLYSPRKAGKFLETLKCFEIRKQLNSDITQKHSRLNEYNTLDTIGVARIFDWGRLNHKSYAMTASKIFKKRNFCGAKIS